jgi:hypothetical protein
MNFEQALKLIVHHRDRNKARDAQYKAVAQKRQHRHSAIREERNNRWRLHHNQQRFAHQSQLADQRSLADTQRDQYRADQEQQQKEADEQQQIQNINTEIDAIENNPGISEEQKRDLTYRLRQKKLGLTPSSPPDQPNYPPEKGIGMTWMEETDDVWPPGHPREGQRIRVWYTRDNRHQVDQVRHEGDEWHKQQNERKQTDAQTAKEEREAREEKRANWEKKGTDALTALLTHRDTTPEEREEIQWILEQREKADKKDQDALDKTTAADDKKEDQLARKNIKAEAKKKAKREVREMRRNWDAGKDDDGNELDKDEDGKPLKKEPRWSDIEADLTEQYEDDAMLEYENEQQAPPTNMPSQYNPNRQVSPLTGGVVSSEVPTNSDTGMLEIV